MIRPISWILAVGLLVASVPVLAQSQPRKVSPQDLSGYWIRTNAYVDAEVPNSGQGLNEIGCAAVTYTIGSDGVTRAVTVAKVVPATSEFQITATSLVQGLRYEPTRGNAHEVPVSTYFIVPFNVPEGDQATMQKVLASCHLPGYGD